MQLILESLASALLIFTVLLHALNCRLFALCGIALVIITTVCLFVEIL